MVRSLRVGFSSRKSIVAAALLLSVVIVIALYSKYSTRQVTLSTCNECKAFNRPPCCSLRRNRHGELRLPSFPCICLSCRTTYTKSGNKQQIPAIRHILWRNEFVSENFATHLRSWQKIDANWTFVLWRDEDMEPFVAAHFPDMLPKFKSLTLHMMRVDMIRYLLLYKYGGVYADLDYTLVKSLDQLRSNYAVLTQEPEAHSLQFFGMTWPPRLLLSPAFMMSAPNHSFFNYVIQTLRFRSPSGGELFFAGPFGLTEITENYRRQCPAGNHKTDIAIVAPSYSFYPYRNNRLNSSEANHIPLRLSALRHRCNQLKSSSDPAHQQLLQQHHQLAQFCTDVTNLDPITDRSQPVFAIHDVEKPGASYDRVGSHFFSEKPTDIRLVLKNLMLGREFI